MPSGCRAELDTCQGLTQGLRPLADVRGEVFDGLYCTLAVRELDQSEFLTLGLFQGGETPDPVRSLLWVESGSLDFLLRMWLLYLRTFLFWGKDN